MSKPRKIKCPICSSKVRPKRGRTVTKMITYSPRTDQYFDVMDCPKCGCEIKLSKRTGYASVKNTPTEAGVTNA